MATDAEGGDSSSFCVPEKKIKTVFDVKKWCQSKAYAGYMAMLHELNDSVRGVVSTADIPISPNVMNCIDMLDTFLKYSLEYPPEDMGSQRFGNKAYRKWHARLTEEAEDAVLELLPVDKKGAVIELTPYILDSFGNPTRIDYGSGHEAAFLVFIYCLRKLGLFTSADNQAIVLRIFLKYLRIVRNLQVTYRMEPAGSRGVHALDDYQFIPFLWGSSQLIGNKNRLVPESYLNPTLVEMHASKNLFFDAVQFINETKTGPFCEHSNQLWNISAVLTWEKVNSGMFKMYEAEVLRQFPVCQHILFGSLFSFDAEPNTTDPNVVEAETAIRLADEKARREHTIPDEFVTKAPWCK
ncbi:hypothetical protein AB6A40_005169 [Gnathostoma spinigerum]|uniref:Serine/threonine-protein phosphatase 2A activator n=1 Tax=Gnathostoma spinigerum TaxID=75299 RepID=A0ABD6EFT0_9BILA